MLALKFMKGIDHDSSASSSPIHKIDTLLPVAPEESIFKSITKRIASLEENMTYAIMYIGEQSTLLTEAFNATYRTKLDAITTLFNHTVLNRLKVLRHELRLLELKETDLERQHRLLEYTSSRAAAGATHKSNSRGTFLQEDLHINTQYTRRRNDCDTREVNACTGGFKE